MVDYPIRDKLIKIVLFNDEKTIGFYNGKDFVDERFNYLFVTMIKEWNYYSVCI